MVKKIRDLRALYDQGKISRQVFEQKFREFINLHLDVMGCKCVENTDGGIRGPAFEMRSPESDKNVLVTIASDDGRPGLSAWPKLAHKNIVPLTTCRTVAQTKVLISKKYSLSLRRQMSSYSREFTGYKQAVACLKGLTAALCYLHGEGLCHLNLTQDSVFFDKSNTPLLMCSEFLTFKDCREIQCGAPGIFSPPEAFAGTSRKMDGMKYDVWSLGVLALEIFTGQHLSSELRKRGSLQDCCFTELYELLVSILDEDVFKGLVKKNFLNRKADERKIAEVLHFVKSCLVLNIEERPSVEELLNLRVFRGTVTKRSSTAQPSIGEAKSIPAKPSDVVTPALKKNRNICVEDAGCQLRDKELKKVQKAITRKVPGNELRIDVLNRNLTKQLTEHIMASAKSTDDEFF